MNLTVNTGSGISLSPQPLPTHVAISISSPQHVPPETTLRNIMELMTLAVSLRIPMLTLHFQQGMTESEVNTITTIFTALMHEQFLDNNQVKISVLGKWYELPERALEPIKHVISSTSDYDRCFVNFCIRYDGQEDIVEGAKLLAKHVQLGKLAPEQITKETLKEAMLTSTLLPPSLIIHTAPARKTGSILLWDSPGATVHFSDFCWKDFGKEAFLNSLLFFQRHN
ncbi:MAG: undecaprenyl diphosphate synthase family protein [Candidatus Woesearchaeota archaeon]